MIRFSCPQCHHLLRAPDTMRSKLYHCPECAQVGVIPPGHPLPPCSEQAPSMWQPLLLGFILGFLVVLSILAAVNRISGN